MHMRFFPLAVAVPMIVTVASVYVAAGMQGHVQWWFPTISDSGAHPPESCVFTLGLTYSALGFAWIIVCQFWNIKQGLAMNDDTPERARRHRRMNLACLVLGLWSAVGMILVASFQDINVPSVHYVGAFSTFLCGVLYGIVMAGLSFRVRKQLGVSPSLIYGRLANACLCGLALATEVLLGLLNRLHDIGFPAVALCEWIMAATFVSYVSLFVFDFRHFRVTLSVVTSNTANSGSENASLMPTVRQPHHINSYTIGQ